MFSIKLILSVIWKCHAIMKVCWVRYIFFLNNWCRLWWMVILHYLNFVNFGFLSTIFKLFTMFTVWYFIVELNVFALVWIEFDTCCRAAVLLLDYSQIMLPCKVMGATGGAGHAYPSRCYSIIFVEVILQVEL